MVASFFRVLIFCGGVWSVVVVALSFLGDPFLFLPFGEGTDLFPPTHRYETFRLTFFTLLAIGSYFHLFAPEKKFTAVQVLAIAMTAFLIIGAITTFRAGEFGREIFLIGTMTLFAVAFLYSARERIKKIWRH
jgi:hypothetical protein